MIYLVKRKLVFIFSKAVWGVCLGFMRGEMGEGVGDKEDYGFFFAVRRKIKEKDRWRDGWRDGKKVKKKRGRCDMDIGK